MRNILKILIFYSFFCKILPAEAQESYNKESDTIKNPLVIGARLHYGFMIKHSQAIAYIKDSYPIGIEIDISRHLVRESAWQSCFCYPRVGFTFSFFDFDNPEVLGYGVCSSIYIEPFFGAYNKFYFSLKAAAGLAYLSNPYDSITNWKNRSYSMLINGYLFIGTCLNYRLNPNINFSISSYFNHTSNGGIKEPNYGINFPSIVMGVDFTPYPQKFRNRIKTKFKTSDQKQKRIDLISFGASKAIHHADKRFFIYGAGINYSQQVARVTALSGGAEWIIDGVIKEEMKRNNISGIDHKQGGILLGHEFLMGRFVFNQQLGIYFYRPYVRDKPVYNDPVYQRYFLIYRFNKYIYAGIGLKAHRYIAEFLDVRVGMTL